MYLDLLLKAGKILEVYPQVSFDLYGKNGGKICTHRVDFLVTDLDGFQYVDEFKGYQTDTWRLKLKLFKDNYPEIQYNVITSNWKKNSSKIWKRTKKKLK